MTCLGRFFENALPPPPPRSNGFNEGRESKEICGNHLVDNVHTLNNLNWIKELCTSLSLKRCHFIPATTTCRLSDLESSFHLWQVHPHLNSQQNIFQYLASRRLRDACSSALLVGSWRNRIRKSGVEMWLHNFLHKQAQACDFINEGKECLYLDILLNHDSQFSDTLIDCVSSTKWLVVFVTTQQVWF